MKRLIRAAVCSAVLLLILPVSTLAAQTLIPVGRVIGLQLQDDTVTVAAFEEESHNRAKAAGLKVGDQIIRVGEQPVRCTQDVRAALDHCDGDVSLTIRRGCKQITLVFAPEQTADGPRMGVYLRQGIAGIGTITYYDPDTGAFGTLGHGVNDPKGALLPMVRGEAYPAEITSVVSGKSGDPGQLKGRADSGDVLGSLLRNTPQGVFGQTASGWDGEAIAVAAPEEIVTGTATIRSTVTGGEPRDYSVEILKIYPREHSQGRNLLLKVTDPELLEITGGIVQGMSGSPIIQNGKLVGAVTHVLVNDPTRGYGIFIENMLEAAA